LPLNPPYEPIQLPDPTEDWDHEPQLVKAEWGSYNPTSVTTLTVPKVVSSETEENWDNETYQILQLPDSTENWDNETYTSIRVPEDWSNETYTHVHVAGSDYCDRPSTSFSPQNIPTHVTEVYRLTTEETPLVEPFRSIDYWNDPAYIPENWDDLLPEDYDDIPDKPTILLPEPLTPENRTRVLNTAPTLPEVQPYYIRPISKKYRSKIEAARKRLGLPDENPFFLPKTVATPPEPTQQQGAAKPDLVVEYDRRPKSTRIDWHHKTAVEISRIKAHKHRKTWQQKFPENCPVFDRETGKFDFITRKERISDFTSQTFRYDHWTHNLDKY
jgi:hypothetical protein